MSGAAARRGGLALLLALAAACSRDAPPPPGHDDLVIGTAALPAGAELPAGATLRAMLLDIDAPDVPDFIVAASEAPAAGASPLDFQLGYDPHGLLPDVLYGVAVEIHLEERVLFETSAPVPVLTRGHPDRVDLVLQPADRPR